LLQLQELDQMKRRLKEMEEEAAALRDMQAKVAKEMQGGPPGVLTACLIFTDAFMFFLLRSAMFISASFDLYCEDLRVP
jgi:hypothetical protein